MHGFTTPNSRSNGRMLKKPASVVLASFRPSTYRKGMPSGLHSLRPRWTVFLSILHRYSLVPQTRELRISRVPRESASKRTGGRCGWI